MTNLLRQRIPKQRPTSCLQAKMLTECRVSICGSQIRSSLAKTLWFNDIVSKLMQPTLFGEGHLIRFPVFNMWPRIDFTLSHAFAKPSKAFGSATGVPFRGMAQDRPKHKQAQLDPTNLRRYFDLHRTTILANTYHMLGHSRDLPAGSHPPEQQSLALGFVNWVKP